MVGRPFQPGQSGNPGGRPARLREVEKLAQQHTTAAITRLLRIIEESDSDTAAARAAEIMLNRGWGMPVQPVAGEEGGPVGFVIMGVQPSGTAQGWLEAHKPKGDAE